MITLNTIVATLIDALIAGGIIIGALYVSRWVRDQIVKLAEAKEGIDDTLGHFFGSVARYAIIVIAAIFVLGQFGIDTTSLAALIGAIGLAVGFALQGSLGNVASGLMIIFFRPFKVDDYITAGGQSGTVDTITLFTTELTTPDNVKIIVPNGDIFSGAITNYSHYDTRRCDLVFGVSYDSDLKKAEKILTDIIAKEPRAHKDPEPFVKVTNLGDRSVDFTCRIWCDSGDYWAMKFDLLRAVKEAFDKGGIDIPFPTQTQINVTAQ